MAKLNSIINEVLYEEKEKNLKIFYSSDIFIQDFPDEKEPQEEPEQEAPAPVETPAPAPAEQGVVEAEETPGGAQEATEEKEKVINEEIFKAKSQGEITVDQEKAKTILTLNDLLEYVDDKKGADGEQIINDLVIETVRALAGEQTKKTVQELLNKGDKCNITIDYGFDKDDSIGLQVSKNPGVNLATMIMRKDGNPMTGQFNLQVFNQTITGVFLKEIQ